MQVGKQHQMGRHHEVGRNHTGRQTSLCRADII
jgi:hypothetical protein